MRFCSWAGVLLVLLSGGAPGAHAQLAYQPLGAMHHTGWSARDGLTGRPTSLAQTRDGFLWIGSTTGLYRFDGVRFERFALAGASAVSVNALAAAPDGGLWVGHTSGGVSHLGPDRRVASYTRADSLPMGVVRSIVVDHEGAVWIATVGGLARFADGQWRTIRADWNYPHKSAWALFVERDGTLWVAGASPDGILYLPRGARRFVDIAVRHSAGGFVQPDDSTVAYVHFDDPTMHFLRRTPGGATTLQVFGNLPSIGVAMDAEGGIWFPGQQLIRHRLVVDSEGRFAIDPAERLPGGELTGSFAMGAMIDREGSAWVISEQGLDRFRRRNVTWSRDSSMLYAASLVTDRAGDVWVLSHQAPSIRRARDNVALAGAPHDERIDNAILDADGVIWFSTVQGLYRWSGDSVTPVPPPPALATHKMPFSVIASTVDSAGRLLVGISGSGVFRRQDDRWSFLTIWPDRKDLAPVAAGTDGDHRVWLAYHEAVARLSGDSIRIFGPKEGLHLGPLLTMGVRGTEVWLGSESGTGFFRGDTFYPVMAADGTEFGPVTVIVTSADGVWLGLSAGYVHIPGEEIQKVIAGGGPRVHNTSFDLESDLPEIPALSSMSRPRRTAVIDGDQVLWFQTMYGLGRIDPRQVSRNPHPPTVVIRRVAADDNDYSAFGPVELPPLTRTLTIEFTALSLVMPERVRFRFRLEGWEEGWHETNSRREVSYTNLTPGAYRFHVLASNNDGVWNETGATLPFTVAPAWFQTLGFKVLVGTALLGLTFVLYRIRLRRISAMLSERYEARLAERTRIARDLHDTLLQTVQGTKLMADAALASDSAAAIRPELERVSTWLGQAVEEGRGAVRTLRGLTAPIGDLAESLRAAADHPSHTHAMAVRMNVTGTVRDLNPIVCDEANRIGYEAIRNACAHARATELTIELDYGNAFQLRVADNGVGIDPVVARAGKPGRFGLHGMRERARSIEGTLAVEARSPGTRVTLLVPGRSAYAPTTPREQ